MIDLTERENELKIAVRAAFTNLRSRIEKVCGTAVLLYANGTWTIKAADETPIARLNLVPLANCGAVAVLCDLHIEPAYRMAGLARLLQDLRVQAATIAGIQVLLATVVTANEPAMRLFRRWQEVARFTNPVTGNEVAMMMLKL